MLCLPPRGVRRAVLLVFASLSGIGLLHDDASARAADSNDPEIRAAVAKARDFLRNRLRGSKDRAASLGGYSLIKAEVPLDDPAVVSALDYVMAKFKDEVYAPADTREGVYIAGCDAMLLEAADPVKYLPELESIAAWLVQKQRPHGGWYYLSENDRNGDTSVTQYAILGLWAAARAGAKVPPQSWDACAAWFLKTQTGDGGFSYQPGPGGSGSAKHTMTAAGAGCVMIAQRYLYPNRLPTEQKQQKVVRNRKKFGVLERVDLDNPKAKGNSSKQAVVTNYDPKVPYAGLDGGAKRAVGWIGQNYSLDDSSWTFYNVYTLERMAALANTPLINGHDWYTEGADLLLRRQTKDGQWRDSSGDIASTAFGILFLTKATSKLLNRSGPVRQIGGGLLAGGRGLPENLTAVDVKNGNVTARKLSGPLDELLVALENPERLEVESVQAAIVEKVQIGNREELIGKLDQIRGLVDHREAEVRRTAVWALGRSGEPSLAPLLIKALADPDLDVVREARTGLCWLSRRPLGLGTPDDPFAGLPEDATEEQRLEAAAKWRTAVQREWQEWYLKVRPYAERDDLINTERPKR